MPGRSPSVAVVIPAYNSQDFIAETLVSLTEQTWPDWRCVVVDDGSTDQTAAIATEFSARDDRFSVRPGKHGGASSARNLGLMSLDEAIPYVMFLDSDDLLVPDALRTLIEELEHRPDAVGAYGTADHIDSSGAAVGGLDHSAIQKNRKVLTGRVRTRPLGPGEDTTFDSLAIHGNIWPPSTAMVRASPARSMGGFLEGLPYMEDWDFFLRISRAGPFVHVDRQVAWYRRRSSASAGPTEADYYASVAALRSDIWASPITTEEQRQTLLQSHRRQHASVVVRKMASLCSPATWRQGLGNVTTELALVLYAAKIAIIGRPQPPEGALWEAVQRGGRPYAR
ncbi:MAG TPA: glycosyltransferase family 2 protein [Acidimicrobiales bacterium]|jgi:glycosyltransferase involved in cell wall biosynthesis|nr:glycosyltransferase family 2 protein [Acidimicrobiales bacterium]